MKFLTVVGARPQLIKGWSRVFFEELGLSAPDHDLNVGSGSHGAQTGPMLEAVELVLDVLQSDTV